MSFGRWQGWMRAAVLAGVGTGVAAMAHASEIHIHGLLDLAIAERGEANEYNTLTRGDSPFDAYGLRVFAEAQVSDRLQVYSQFVLRDATTPYVDGAYLLFTPQPVRDLHVMAGKLPWSIGTYAPRTYSNKNPLVSSPLMYQYHTSLLWFEIVPSADVLLAASGTGQEGVDYYGYAEGFGMPLVDDSYWDVGVAVTGSERPMEYSLGVMAGTPGWGSTIQDENSGKTVLGRIGLAPIPALRFGVSGAYGPYLVEELNPMLPPGKTVNDYHQQLAMADLEVLIGHVELRAEGALNTWETPTVGNLDVHGGYAELKYTLGSGVFLAGRWDALRFGEIADSNGVKSPWDSDVTRWEAGVGYRFSRDVVAKAVHQYTELENERAVERRREYRLFAAQLSLSF